MKAGGPNESHVFMRAAYDQALKSYEEGGLPIGAAMVENGVIVAVGHNRRVQDGDPIAHGEMDCLRKGGRRRDYAGVTLYTTLSPRMMCSGTIDFLRQHGVDVLVLDDPDCIELMARFIRERPELWYEDIAGRDKF